jgi:hypothetical protein
LLVAALGLFLLGGCLAASVVVVDLDRYQTFTQAIASFAGAATVIGAGALVMGCTLAVSPWIAPSGGPTIESPSQFSPA